MTEDMGIPCIDWRTGAPLTNQGWFGGPYTLVNEYDPAHDVGVATSDEGVEYYQFAEEPAAEETEVITINGKEYTVEEAREILGVKL